MPIRTLLKGGLLALSLTCAAHAAISAEEAAKLGTELTPLGANPEGNAAGTIPPWTGGLTTPPTGYKASSGDYIDPFADEQPLYVITAANMAQYDQHLTEGTKALLQRFPDTYYLPVYKTHRTAAYPQHVYDDIKQDAQSVELVDGGIGIRNAGKGRTPFPIPKSGAELMWNMTSRYFGDDIIMTYANFPVHTNGAYTPVKARMHRVAPGALFNNPQFDMMMFYELFAPAANVGFKLLVHDPTNKASGVRQTWAYNPGQRRVLRAPDIAYDTPVDGSDGLVTMDQSDCFNGALDRYDWTLVGKRELIVPYNNYKLNSLQTKVSDIIGKQHINPNLNRYELHRAWVVEATLREGKRHVFTKRHYYLDEDSYICLGADLYDSRGELWRVVVPSNVQMYDVPMMMQRLEAHYDLHASRYMVQYVSNEEGPYQIGNGATPAHFTAGRLRRSSH